MCIRDRAYPATVITTHHPIARTAFEPSGVPSSSPRMVSMNGVNGWYCANPCNHTGIDSVGTKPLPRNGSGFVPTESMPVWLQGFAQYQPFTPFIETIRGLLLGTQLGSSPALAIGWCVVITGAGYAWSTAIYERKSVR